MGSTNDYQTASSKEESDDKVLMASAQVETFK